MLESIDWVALLFLGGGIVFAVLSFYKLTQYGIGVLFWGLMILVGGWAANYGWETLGLPVPFASQEWVERLNELPASETLQDLHLKEQLQEWCAKI